MAESSKSAPEHGRRLVKERVWDLPVRLFHWLAVVAVGAGWYLGYFRSFETINYHFYVGYAVGGLVALRLIWGLFGNRAARLTSLVWSPMAIIRYAGSLFERKPSGFRGHSPIGSLSVIALLVSLAVQVITGLGSEDDGLFASGPLAGYLDASTVREMTALHYYNSRILIGLIALHLAAIAWYGLFKRENLVTAMVTGDKVVVADAVPEQDRSSV